MLTPEQITHYSRLMAEFMGAKISTHWVNEVTYTYNEPPASNCSYNWELKAMKYHTSYNWLHRVWVKFRDLKFPPNESDTHAWMVISLGTSISFFTHQEAFIELGAAIEWYNTVTQKTEKV